jgi:hypothetical protein
MKLRLGMVLAALLAVAAGGRPADAQGVARSTSEFVSWRGGNDATSLVGGGTTMAGAARTLQATGRGTSLFGRENLNYMRGNSQYTRMSSLGAGELGLYNTLSLPRGAPLSADKNPRGELASLSGLTAAMSLQLPVAGVGAGGLPLLSAAEYTPRPPTTPFENYFGLTASPLPKSKDWKPVFKSVVGEMERQNAERCRAEEREGVALFRAATVEARDARTGRYPNCRDCELSQLRAKQKLTLVRDLDARAHLPCILLAHITLQQERPTLAIVYLREAFERDPNLFSEGAAALAQYFGDVGASGRSVALDADMQRYLRIGELNPGSAEAHVLAAYCAWRLGDTMRLRHETQEGIDLLRADPSREVRWMGFLVALQVGQP